MTTPQSLSKRYGRKRPDLNWADTKRLNFGGGAFDGTRVIVDNDSPIRWIRGPDGRLDHLAMERERQRRASVWKRSVKPPETPAAADALVKPRTPAVTPLSVPSPSPERPMSPPRNTRKTTASTTPRGSRAKQSSSEDSPGFAFWTVLAILFWLIICLSLMLKNGGDGVLPRSHSSRTSFPPAMPNIVEGGADHASVEHLRIVQEQIAVLKAEIAAVSAHVSKDSKALSSGVATNKAALSSLKTSVSQLGPSVEAKHKTLGDSVTENSAAISKVVKAVEKVDAKAVQQKSALDAVGNRLQSDISANKKSAAALQRSIDELKTLQVSQDSALKSAKGDLEKKMAENTASLSKLRKDVDAVSPKLRSQRESIASVETTMSSKIADEIARVKALIPKSADASGSSSIDESHLAGLASKTSVELEVSRLQTHIDRLQAQLSELQKRKPPQSSPSLSEKDVIGIIRQHAPKPSNSALPPQKPDATATKAAVARVDWALGSAGASIVREGTSSSHFGEKDWKVAINALLGSPRSWLPAQHAISSQILSPGRCWAFSGSAGTLTVKLAKPVAVKSVTIENPLKAIANDVSFEAKDFRVFGLVNSASSSGDLLASALSYDVDKAQEAQTFPVANDEDKVYSAVRFEFTSNQGNPDFTCIYRVQVHSAA